MRGLRIRRFLLLKHQLGIHRLRPSVIQLALRGPEGALAPLGRHEASVPGRMDREVADGLAQMPIVERLLLEQRRLKRLSGDLPRPGHHQLRAVGRLHREKQPGPAGKRLIEIDRLPRAGSREHERPGLPDHAVRQRVMSGVDREVGDPLTPVMVIPMLPAQVVPLLESHLRPRPADVAQPRRPRITPPMGRHPGDHHRVGQLGRREPHPPPILVDRRDPFAPRAFGEPGGVT